MILWSEAAPAIKALLERLAQTPAQKAATSPVFKARWSGKATGFINPKAKAELILKLRSVSSVGEDETRYEDIDDVRKETIAGHRLIVIEVRCESHRHGEDTDNWAWTMAGNIRSKLRRQSSLAALRAVNLGLVEVSPALDISYTVDNREINAAAFELTLSGAFRDVDDDTPFEWFERALVTSHAQRPDGTELGAPPNYTDEPMGNP